ncbi:Co2+/Mg2+ efflux protein ApaG [Isoalcanivorax beigongshangi]|uniref:Protein ApaG n=1 Tax=Isoalcanivorax beigongshangi TaxID=3238810 RepID=A0ABV4AFE3_9GAMM
MNHAADPAQVYAIDVTTVAEFLAEQSDDDAERYVFAYHITVTNNGSLPAKLLTRHWIITDGDEQVQEVHGEGVVGEHPHLAPGDAFAYTSVAILPTPFGTMQGSYQMLADDGHYFDAAIAPFTLARPLMLH